MFRRITETADCLVSFTFEGKSLSAANGDTVAAALLANGVVQFRQSVNSHAVRGPVCLIGNCFECLVEINGKANQRACQQQIQDGMQIKMQLGPADLTGHYDG